MVLALILHIKDKVSSTLPSIKKNYLKQKRSMLTTLHQLRQHLLAIEEMKLL